MSDSSVIWFVNPQYTISSLGGGATGFAGSSAPGLTVKAFSEDILRIADNQLLINCIRVYTSEGYLDFGVTPNKAQIIKQNLLLILNSMDTPQNLINVENYSFNNKKNHYEDYSPEDYSEYICQDKYISSSGKYTIRVYTLKNPAIKTIPVCVDVYNRAQEGEFLLKADIEQYVKKKKNK